MNQGSAPLPTITIEKRRHVLRQYKNKSPRESQIVIKAVKIGQQKLLKLKSIFSLFNICLQIA